MIRSSAVRVLVLKVLLPRQRAKELAAELAEEASSIGLTDCHTHLRKVQEGDWDLFNLRQVLEELETGKEP